LNLLLPVARFSGENLVGGLPTPGSIGGNAATAAGVGSLAGVWSADQNLKFGFSLEAPFGQRLSYSSDFVGRYQSLVSSVTDIELAWLRRIVSTSTSPSAAVLSSIISRRG
jgi:long-chain fatty acid transport protein